nr:hypothetical protein [Nonlabens ulvanivorans]
MALFPASTFLLVAVALDPVNTLGGGVGLLPLLALDGATLLNLELTAVDDTFTACIGPVRTVFSLVSVTAFPLESVAFTQLLLIFSFNVATTTIL